MKKGAKLGIVLVVVIVLIVGIPLGVVGIQVLLNDAQQDARRKENKPIYEEALRNYQGKINLKVLSKTTTHLNVQIQNNGDLEIDMLAITIHFLDASNKPIADGSCRVHDLKPHYIQEDTISTSNAPSAWSGEIQYEIDEIVFKGIDYSPSYRY